MSFAGQPPPVRRRTVLAGGLGVAAAAVTAGCGSAAGVTRGPDGRLTVKVLAFQPPSLGAFLPAVIEKQRIDARHGLRIAFSYATPDNYNTEFASGHYQVGGSAALLSEALRTERGVDVTYLFNLFDYFCTVVTSDPGIRTLPDLHGRRLAAATGTTNHAMFAWFARRAGLDLDRVELLNQTTAGLSTMALIGRSDATEMWEPAYSSLRARKPGIRALDIGMERWRSAFGVDTIPYLGLAAHRDWVRKHPDVVGKLYRVYADAAAWTTRNPAAAAGIVAAAMPKGKPKTIQGLIRSQERLRMNVRPASALADGIAAVFRAGRETGYLEKTPPSTIVHQGL